MHTIADANQAIELILLTMDAVTAMLFFSSTCLTLLKKGLS